MKRSIVNTSHFHPTSIPCNKNIMLLKRILLSPKLNTKELRMILIKKLRQMRKKRKSWARNMMISKKVRIKKKERLKHYYLKLLKASKSIKIWTALRLSNIKRPQSLNKSKRVRSKRKRRSSRILTINLQSPWKDLKPSLNIKTKSSKSQLLKRKNWLRNKTFW